MKLNFKNLISFGTTLAILSVSLAPKSANAVAIAGVNLTVNGIVKAIGLTADLVTLYGLSGSNAGSNSIVTTFSGDEYDFSLLIRGTDIKSTVNTPITGQAFGIKNLVGGGTANVPLWSFDVTLQFVSYNDSFVFNDTLTVNGNVRHEIGPDPGDAVQGPPLPFLLKIDADNEVNNKVKETLNPLPKDPHPGTAKHTDELTDATLQGLTSSTLNFDSIDSWNFIVKANHSCTATQGNSPLSLQNSEFIGCPIVPEPSSVLSLLALGTLGAASTLKRKLKSSQSTEKETTKVS
ncbi:PEP-CTERM sorting domain-containing protein [Microcystis aeruginosa CS-563/04]|jgi:hypothetical protein|uniref:PEP-CTERM sorting domain-containing protein n=1 Tax=Microcystis aeruginosa TaxID=1126 RepID=UPI00232EE081|nr:PEP-CTERM sorting domain-containing protein [Microcystis aeruginosa]MDB9421795.1 PEP-CTERM sorting domain-containing protein [Microcystis aeruginosa CS-563/04]